MVSIIKVDNIQNTAGETVLSNGYPTQPGQIIEYLTSQCDGSQLTGLGGTFTWQNVTAVQATTNVYADVTGSSIAYTPPPGTSKVIYQFNFGYYWQSIAHSIQHFKFFIDSDEVLLARHNRSASHYENRYMFEWVIPIGGTGNTNTGRQATWTSNKTLKMQTRRYALNSHGGQMHGTFYWDGTTSTQFNIPSLSLIAIA